MVVWSPVMLRMCMVYVLRLVDRVDKVVAMLLCRVTTGLLVLVVFVLASTVETKCPWDRLTSIGHLAVWKALSLASSGRPRLTLGPEKFRFGLTTTCLGPMLVVSILLIRCTSLLRMLANILRLQMEALRLGPVFPELVS